MGRDCGVIVFPHVQAADRCKHRGENPGGSQNPPEQQNRSGSGNLGPHGSPQTSRMKILKNPYIQGFLVVVASIIVLGILRENGVTSKIPFVGKYL